MNVFYVDQLASKQRARRRDDGGLVDFQIAHDPEQFLHRNVLAHSAQDFALYRINLMFYSQGLSQ